MKNTDSLNPKATIQSKKQPAQASDFSSYFITFIEQLSTEAMVISGKQYHILWSNHAFHQLSGYTKEECLNLSLLDLCSEKDHLTIKTQIERSSKNPYEIEGRKKNGLLIPLQIKGNTLTHKGQTIRVTTIVDLTESRRIQEEQQRSYNELETFFTNSVFGVIMLRGGRKVYRANQRFADIFGYANPAEVEGKQVIDFHLSEEKYLAFGNKYYDRLIQKDMIQIEYQVKKKDGSSVWVSISGRAIDPASPPNLDDGVVWIFEDISKRKQMERQLLEMATTDTLTQVYNRRYFFEQAEKEYARFKRHSDPLSILVLDVDHFKSINDTYGHQTGDDVLRLLATQCMENLRAEDIFGRIGGEEFCAILPHTDLNTAMQVAERIRAVIEEVHLLTDPTLPRITASIGVVEADRDSTLKDACGQADACLYAAKRAGRNRVKGL